MSKLGKPIARRINPTRSCPSPAAIAPARTIATLPMKNGLSRLPRRSSRIGFAPPGASAPAGGGGTLFTGDDDADGERAVDLEFPWPGGGLLMVPPSETFPVCTTELPAAASEGDAEETTADDGVRPGPGAPDERPAAGPSDIKAAPHRGQYFALSLGKALEHFGHSDIRPQILT
jgi:hypothetical protein